VISVAAVAAAAAIARTHAQRYALTIALGEIHRAALCAATPAAELARSAGIAAAAAVLRIAEDTGAARAGSTKHQARLAAARARQAPLPGTATATAGATVLRRRAQVHAAIATSAVVTRTRRHALTALAEWCIRRTASPAHARAASVRRSCPPNPCARTAEATAHAAAGGARAEASVETSDADRAAHRAACAARSATMACTGTGNRRLTRARVRPYRSAPGIAGTIGGRAGSLRPAARIR